MELDHIYPSSPLLLSRVTLEHVPLSTSRPPAHNPLHPFSAVCLVLADLVGLFLYRSCAGDRSFSELLSTMGLPQPRDSTTSLLRGEPGSHQVGPAGWLASPEDTPVSVCPRAGDYKLT